jgi:phage pi2 protein 07
MEKLGCICTRKFTTDLSLVRACKKVLKEYGDIFCMYPEARYTPDGTLQVLPNAIGKLAKKNNVPVVVMLNHGNYLNLPFWTDFKFRKTPIRVEMKQILTAEQVAELSVDEINTIIRKEMEYNDYKWQNENNIRIKEKYRAEGLHKVLYQCPHCLTESKMNSSGTEIYCEECGKRWNLNEDGTLKALNGQTEFTHIPDWYNWEREQVRKQILDGTYRFEDNVDVYSLPRCWRFIHLGDATLTHDINEGFTLIGHYRGQDYKIERKPLGQIGLHIEYDYCYIKPFDCVDISTDKDSFYCYPTKQNVVTKLSFATEEIYRLNQERAKKSTEKI